ncbi:hypothetical protein BDN71DRAFT_1432602 [Pleurotus eryngii]|uniref:Uncharacterized protein n=1 Tax=Pleurotus eryngii TaxID=5323 RepID=A0A9P5ZTJ6_PLEER|nr:hypothetical protein BDN71DRAFT_1432602 [Pleurotus eryngii]
MVASLAVQVVALSPVVNNTNIGSTAQPPAAQPPAAQPPAAQTPAAQAPAANQAMAPIVPVSNVPAAGSASAESSDDPGVADNLQPSSSSAHQHWYVMIVSAQVGVFHGWTNAAPLVLGVASSIYNWEPTCKAAIVAFNAATAIDQVHLVD